jgi:diguanylate cyclase (GGDEF)-like protein
MVAGGHPDTIVLIEPDPRAAARIRQLLRQSWPEAGGLRLRCVERPAQAAEVLRAHPSGIVLLGVSSEARLRAVAELRAVAPAATIVVLADRDHEAEALAAIEAGAQDYLTEPELSAATLRRAVKLAVARTRAADRLTHQALHDSLTGLSNRALFLDRLGLALDRCRRSGGCVAVLFLDVDGFKQINDSLGHDAGDRVLVSLAERLRALLRPADTLCRYGGDEFTLLIEDLESEHEVVPIAERISQAAALPIALERGHAEVTVSIGVAIVADPNVAVEAVIREADAAMYRAKRAGRARFALAHDGSAAAASSA